MSVSAIYHTLWFQTIFGYMLMFSVPVLLPALFIKLVGFKGLRNLLSYESHETIVHQLDPRIKIVYPVCVGSISVFLEWQYVYGLLFFTVIPWIMLKPSSIRLRVILTMSIAPAIGMVWSQGIFHTTVGVSSNDLLFKMPSTLAWLGTPGLQHSGLVYGAQEAGRMLVTVSASLLLIMTTRPSDIIWAIKSVRLPASAGLALSVALRFLPKMFERLTTLLQAMEVRGYQFKAPAWYKLHLWPDYIVRILLSIPIVTVPLLVGSLRETAVMSMVVDARAFGVTKDRTTYRQHTIKTADKVGWAYLGLMIASVMVLFAFHLGLRTQVG